MTTLGTAATSDARKRLAEKSDQPPTLPDTSGWEPIELTDGERKFLAESTATLESKVERIVGLRLAGKEALLDPPPVEPAPWEDISTDAESPTLAWVRLGPNVQPVLRHWYRNDELLFSPNPHGKFTTQATCTLEQVTDVELIHTYDPETHVPVERALIDEAARMVAWWSAQTSERPEKRDAHEYVWALAALADGAEKGAES